MERTFSRHFPPVPREVQISNLQKLRERKQERLAELENYRSRKIGQIRAYSQATYLMQREIEREKKELNIIEEEITSLSQ